MGEGRTAIIIGAGIGGIATAVFLAKNGYLVSVYEKNSSAGGRAGQLVRDGYRFDLGATMLLMPNIYHDVFNSLGIPLEEGRDIIPLENLYKIYFDDMSELAFSTDKEKMKLQLEKIEKGSFEKSEKYVKKGYEIFRSSMKKLINRNFYNVFQMINPGNIPLLFKIKVFTSHFRYTSKFFKHSHLRMSYTFQNIYVGQSPFNSPALFSMVPAAELMEGSFFPSGNGMFTIVEKLSKAALEAGVKFYFKKAVLRIVTKNRQVTGVLLEDNNEINADLVIGNADLPYIYKNLLPDKRRAAHFDRLRYSCSAICFHWGLDKVYPLLDHHNVFLSDGFRNGLDRIFLEKSISDNPSFYVHAPARTDLKAAPEGHDALSIIVAAGHVDKKFHQDWDRIKNKARSAVIDRLKKQGLNDIDEHIKFEACFTPENWEMVCNISRGSVFGSLAHNIFQMGYFRPHNRHDKYKNLYFVGGSTHPGNGIPNVLLSAKLVSERILKENRN